MRTRHDYQWVTDRIALGSAVADRDQVGALVGDGVTHVLDCRVTPPDDRLYWGTGIVYRQLGVRDDGERKPDEWFLGGIDFAMEALQWRHARVLVHCRMGMSRAPSMRSCARSARPRTTPPRRSRRPASSPR